MLKMSKKPLIAVGLSGGVDSAVAAYLLKKQGYKVFGVFMVNVDAKVTPGVRCRWQDDYESARAAAKHLGIPLYTWNFVKEYKQQILNDFFYEFKQGRTPNPDVWCNANIKFGTFLNQALQVGATRVATGHYAGVKLGKDKKYQLLKGVDPNKDQSYFLYRANQFTLAHSMFPLSNMSKPQVRDLARKIKLPNSARPDSQGICFVGEVKIYDFLKQHLANKPGKIIDSRGRVLGQHNGAWFYTIGQREGMGLTNGPWYVYKIDVKKNILHVTNKPQDKKLYTRKFSLDQVHWVSGQAPFKPLNCTVEVRYHQLKPRLGIVKRIGNKWIVQLTEAERAVTPGQHAVFYSGRQVLGGGVIKLLL